MTLTSILSNVLTVLLVVVHMGLVLVDFVGVYPVADFLIRPDGSQMDPKGFLPQEEVLVALLAFPFLTCVLGFVCCSQRKDAALVSALTHAIFAGHQIWKKSIWDALVHPEASITIDFFIYSHVGWTVVSMLIYYLSPVMKAEASSSGEGAKIKRV